MHLKYSTVNTDPVKSILAVIFDIGSTDDEAKNAWTGAGSTVPSQPFFAASIRPSWLALVLANMFKSILGLTPIKGIVRPCSS